MEFQCNYGKVNLCWDCFEKLGLAEQPPEHCNIIYRTQLALRKTKFIQRMILCSHLKWQYSLHQSNRQRFGLGCRDTDMTIYCTEQMIYTAARFHKNRMWFMGRLELEADILYLEKIKREKKERESCQKTKS